jgi:hypothetical protein
VGIHVCVAKSGGRVSRTSTQTNGGAGRPWRRQATALPCVNVIRLDAATVLLQWATGGMLFGWFTTRRRIIGVGYGWLVRGVYLCFAIGALAAGLRFGVVPVREIASAGVAVGCLFALVVSVIRRKAGVSGQQAEFDRRSERVAAMTGIDRTVSASATTTTAGATASIDPELASTAATPRLHSYVRSSVPRSSARSPTPCSWVTGISCSPACRASC